MLSHVYALKYFQMSYFMAIKYISLLTTAVMEILSVYYYKDLFQKAALL